MSVRPISGMELEELPPNLNPILPLNLLPNYSQVYFPTSPPSLLGLSPLEYTPVKTAPPPTSTPSLAPTPLEYAPNLKEPPHLESLTPKQPPHIEPQPQAMAPAAAAQPPPAPRPRVPRPVILIHRAYAAADVATSCCPYHGVRLMTKARWLVRQLPLETYRRWKRRPRSLGAAERAELVVFARLWTFLAVEVGEAVGEEGALRDVYEMVMAEMDRSV